MNFFFLRGMPTASRTSKLCRFQKRSKLAQTVEVTRKTSFLQIYFSTQFVEHDGGSNARVSSYIFFFNSKLLKDDDGKNKGGAIFCFPLRNRLFFKIFQKKSKSRMHYPTMKRRNKFVLFLHVSDHDA